MTLHPMAIQTYSTDTTLVVLRLIAALEPLVMPCHGPPESSHTGFPRRHDCFAGGWRRHPNRVAHHRGVGGHAGKIISRRVVRWIRPEAIIGGGGVLGDALNGRSGNRRSMASSGCDRAILLGGLPPREAILSWPSFARGFRWECHYCLAFRSPARAGWDPKFFGAELDGPGVSLDALPAEET